MQALAATELAALVDTTGLAGVSVRWVTEPSQKSSMSQLLVDAATALTH